MSIDSFLHVRTEEPCSVRGSIRNIEAYAEAALRRRTERFDECFPRSGAFAPESCTEEEAKQFVQQWASARKPEP
jgi:hypothetical protein